jgi:hypothetical protein
MFRRAKETWLSWHRGLPNPPGKPELTFALMRRAFQENNALYFRGLRDFYFGFFKRKVDTKALAEQELEKESAKAARDLASAALDTSRAGPDAIRKWLAERAAILSHTMSRFGAGFQEGKNAPDIKLDWKEWFKPPKT